MAGRNRTSSRGPTLPAHEESQIWTEAYTTLKQIPEAHTKAQKLAAELNKHQRVLQALGNGDGRLLNRVLMLEASAELLGKLENIYQEGVRVAENQARFDSDLG
jgi:hypothetical protein